MIELIGATECDTCDRVRLQLRDLTIAHREIVVGRHARRHHVIREGERVVDEEELDGYLAELARFAADWQRFQSDACFIEDDGTIC